MLVPLQLIQLILHLLLIEDHLLHLFLILLVLAFQILILELKLTDQLLLPVIINRTSLLLLEHLVDLVRKPLSYPTLQVFVLLHEDFVLLSHVMALELLLNLSEPLVNEVALVAHVEAQLLKVPGVLFDQRHLGIGLLKDFLVVNSVAKQLLKAPLRSLLRLDPLIQSSSHLIA